MRGLTGNLLIDSATRRRIRPSIYATRLGPSGHLSPTAVFSAHRQRWRDVQRRANTSPTASAPQQSTSRRLAQAVRRLQQSDADADWPTLRITSILDTPFLMLRRSTKELSGNNRFEGYVMDLLDHIAGRLHFNYTLELVKDGGYGAPEAGAEKGRWNGMVGEVMRAEADLAVAPITITYAREKVRTFCI